MSTRSRSILAAVFRRDIFRIKRKLVESRFSDGGQVWDWTVRETARDPLGAMLERGGITDEDLEAAESNTWFDVFMHKILIHFSILARYYAGPSTLKYLRPFLIWTQSEVERYRDEVVLKMNPELALTITTLLASGPL
ncbi:uncharacterized protein JCM6883_006498 [Sporobolomyces salmoneus]|uniref:uncharacterized protein n=1 Tax=Sporobolomyces salmoneus TaxID=183962 RepID=UPI0031823056